MALRRWSASDAPSWKGPKSADLGGYEATDGRRVKWGRIFRSSNLARLTDKGLDQIKRLGIRLVCDFRTEAEAAKLPTDSRLGGRRLCAASHSAR